MFRKLTNPLIVMVLIVSVLIPLPVTAEEHVVASQELQSAIKASADRREKDLRELENFFSSEPVANALKNANVDPIRVQQAMPMLSDEELARLSTKVQTANQDFAAGVLSNKELTFVVIGLAFIILIIAIAD